MPSGGEVCAGGFMASEFGMHLSHCPRIAFGRGGRRLLAGTADAWLAATWCSCVRRSA